MTLHSPFSRSSLRSYLSIILLITNLGLYALLVIRDTIPITGLILLGLFWILHWAVSKHLSVRSPVDLPVLGLAALLLVSLVISIDHGLTLPKVYGLVLSISLFYWLVNYLSSISRLWLVTLGLALLALALPLVCLLAADWSGSSFTLPSRIVNRLTASVPFLGRLSAGGGIHVNTVGGTLTFFVPLLVSLLWDGGSLRRTFFRNLKNARAVNILLKLLVLAALALTLAVLALTQSRASYLGAGTGLLVLLIWKRPRFFWLIPLLMVIFFAALLIFANGDLLDFISILDTSREGDTVQVRLDYWKRTVFLIQDFPISGVGLGTYGKVFDELYTFTPFASSGGPSFYAHNMYLAVAASMGIPALVLYLALFAGCGLMVYYAFKKVRSAARVLLIGLSCGVLANLIYGLWDNYLPGEKLAIVLWIFLGVIAAISLHQQQFAHRQHAEPHASAELSGEKSENTAVRIEFRAALIGIGAWLLISLAALAFTNIAAYFSLAVAAVGGMLLGWLLTRVYNQSNNNLFSLRTT